MSTSRVNFAIESRSQRQLRAAARGQGPKSVSPSGELTRRAQAAGAVFSRSQFRGLDEPDFGKIADDRMGWFGGERRIPGSKYQAGLKTGSTSRIQFGDHITEEQDFVRRHAKLGGNSLIAGRLAFGPGRGVIMTAKERQQVALDRVSKKESLSGDTAGRVNPQIDPRSVPLFERGSNIRVEVSLKLTARESRFPNQSLQLFQACCFDIPIHQFQNVSPHPSLCCLHWSRIDGIAMRTGFGNVGRRIERGRLLLSHIRQAGRSVGRQRRGFVARGFVARGWGRACGRDGAGCGLSLRDLVDCRRLWVSRGIALWVGLIRLLEPGASGRVTGVESNSFASRLKGRLIPVLTKIALQLATYERKHDVVDEVDRGGRSLNVQQDPAAGELH